MYIGVIGGVGPYAGLDMHRLLTNAAKAEKDQDHYPLFIASLPHEITDRSDFILGIDNVNPGFAIRRQIKKLYNAGCRVIGVACNTAHSKIIWEVIESGVNELDDLELVNMIEETFKRVSLELGRAKVLLLATLGTYHADTFHDYAMKYNVKLVYPSSDNQRVLHHVIYEKKAGLKSKGVLRGKNKKYVNDLIKQELIKDEDINGILLGCTELSLVSESLKLEGRLVYKTNSILASSLIELFNSIRIEGY